MIILSNVTDRFDDQSLVGGESFFEPVMPKQRQSFLFQLYLIFTLVIKGGLCNI